MGGLFSSCMNNGKNENNDTNADTKDNSQKQTKSKNKTSKKQNKESKTENTQDPDADKNKQIELSTSVSATQETGSSNTEVKDETKEQKNITQDVVSPKPAAQNPPAPVSVKPIPRYDYVCEFLFDVKAVGNSVNLECRISWTKIDALLYLSVRIHMERRFLPSRRYFRRILEIKI